MTRVCSKCNIEKELTYENFRYRDGTRNLNKLRKDCRECGKARDIKYHVLNRETRIQYGKAFRNSEHGKQIRETNRPKYRALNRELRLRVLKSYSENGEIKCKSCGEDFLDFLHLDHVNGDGKKDRKERGVGINFYNSLEKDNYPDPEKYRILCANCNLCITRADWTFEKLKAYMNQKKLGVK